MAPLFAVLCFNTRTNQLTMSSGPSRSLQKMQDCMYYDAQTAIMLASDPGSDFTRLNTPEDYQHLAAQNHLQFIYTPEECFLLYADKKNFIRWKLIPVPGSID